MFDFIYAEESILDHPRTRALLGRFPRAQLVSCARYGEVFNRTAQNFRLQKRRPALILAHKAGRRVLPAPDGYGIGSERNYYFSHLLNCPYDCRYLLPPRPVPLGALSPLCQLRGLPTGHRRAHRRGRTRCALFLFWLRLRQPRARGHYPFYSRLPPLLCRPSAGLF